MPEINFELHRMPPWFLKVLMSIMTVFSLSLLLIIYFLFTGYAINTSSGIEVYKVESKWRHVTDLNDFSSECEYRAEIIDITGEYELYKGSFIYPSVVTKKGLLLDFAKGVIIDIESKDKTKAIFDRFSPKQTDASIKVYAKCSEKVA